MNPDAVPAELRERRQWVCWRDEIRRGKPTKVPYQSNGGRAATNDESTWTSFDEAIKASARFDGVGYVFADDDPYVGVDLDGCIDPESGETAAWATEVTSHFPGAYTEVSPSGTGLKLWVKGELPDRCRHKVNLNDAPQVAPKMPAIEAYSRLRFFTVTGRTPSGTVEGIADAREGLVWLVDRYLRRPAPEPPRPSINASPLGDRAIIDKARAANNGHKFVALFDRGDLGAYGDDHSAADAALSAMIKFWTQDPVQIDRIFRASALMRPKWDEPHHADGSTYGEGTIRRALALGGETYRGAFAHTGAGAKDDGEPPAENVGPPVTEDEFALAFVEEHGDGVRHCRALGAWYVWAGTHWKRGETGEVERLAKRTLRRLLIEAADIADARARSEQLRRVARMGSARGVRDLLTLASTEPEVAIGLAAFDQDPWLFNVRNGTIDLRTGVLRAHDREDQITKLAPVAFVPGAADERWTRFLAETTGGDLVLMDFLKRAVGYSLTGDTSEETLFLPHGDGASGKSTFISALRGVMGDYAMVADFETFLARRGEGGIRNDIARLAGARMVTSIEVDEGRKLAEGLVKTLTGGDVVAARFLYREAFEFQPTFKLWLVANEAPAIRETDDAMWRRVIRIPFAHVVPKEKRDKRVKKELTSDPAVQRAILAWAVEGCLDWQRMGLAIPSAVAEATATYRLDQDIYSEFVDDRLEWGSELQDTTAAIWEAWSQWRGIHQPDEKGSKKGLAVKLQQRGARPARIGPMQQRGWIGVAVSGSMSRNETSARQIDR